MDELKELYEYCKRLEEDSYTASDVAEQDGRQRLSDSLFGESMAYCHMAHKLEELISENKKGGAEA